jgi:hypothetical protein
MIRPVRQIVCVAVMAALVLPAVAQQRKGRARHKSPAKKTQPAPQPYLPPPPPPTPEQMPPNPPQVGYAGGQLSIVADNSTLADVLNAVRARTGAKLDMPPNASGVRVAVHIGPGEPRDVLAQLLAGSRFDYVLLGSATDPGAVTDIVLTPREGGTAMANAGPPPPSGPPGGVQAAYPPPTTPPGEDADESEPEPPAEPIPQTVTPPQGTGAAPNQPQSNQPKTPQQLLEELQRMQQIQQLRQQQQQQQPQPPPRRD